MKTITLLLLINLSINCLGQYKSKPIQFKPDSWIKKTDKSDKILIITGLSFMAASYTLAEYAIKYDNKNALTASRACFAIGASFTITFFIKPQKLRPPEETVKCKYKSKRK